MLIFYYLELATDDPSRTYCRVELISDFRNVLFPCMFFNLDHPEAMSSALLYLKNES